MTKTAVAITTITFAATTTSTHPNVLHLPNISPLSYYLIEFFYCCISFYFLSNDNEEDVVLTDKIFHHQEVGGRLI